MATLTGTAVVNQQAKAVHAGLNGIYAEHSSTATLTIGDIVLLAKIPDRARIVDGWFVPPGPGTYNVGLYNVSDGGSVAASDADQFIVSATGAGTRINFFNVASAVGTGAGFQVSISHTNIVRHRILATTILSTSGTTSGKYQVYAEYYMDGESTA